MKIERIELRNLRNEEHFQFHTDFLSATEPHYRDMGITDPLFTEYRALYDDLDLVLEQLSKSHLTAKIEHADKLRDATFRGFRDAVKSNLTHFETAKKEAASKLMIVFKQYGDVANKSYLHETAAIYNLVQDMDGKYRDEVSLLDLREWVQRLETHNNAFTALRHERTEERSGKPNMRVVDVRKNVDVCYNKIVAHIEAFTLLNPGHGLDSLITTINSNNLLYKNMIAKRKGKGKAN